MENLYQIQQNLLNVFEQLEENGGELTPELEEQLAINEDNLRVKLENYCKFIREVESKIESSKVEEKRLTTLRKSRENKVDYLKNTVLIAVQQFGNTQRNGVKSIELDTFKLSTRKSTSVELNDSRITELIKTVIEYINELLYNGIYETGDDAAVELLNVINQLAGDDYTLDDLKNTTVEVTNKMSLYDLLFYKGKLLEDNVEVRNAIAKSDIKEDLDNPNINMTIANLKENYKLQIK